MSNLSAEELVVIKAALEAYKPSNAAIILKLKVKQELDKRLGF